MVTSASFATPLGSPVHSNWQQSNGYRWNECSIVRGTRFATVPQIGLIGVPQVRVGIVDRVISRQSHAFLCNSRIIVHV